MNKDDDMAEGSMHLFISTDLVREAEKMTTLKGNLPGRPTAHSTCLILAMLVIKSMFGIGYRETDRLFRDSDYQNLPDFRTIQWRAERLRKKKLHMNASVRKGRYENVVLVELSDGREFVSIKEVNSSSWSKAMRRIRRNFVELML